MEHFYQNIHGWFSYEHIYKDMVKQASDGDLFVEIGSFKGKSTAFMCVEIANSLKNIKFDCIDPMVPLSHYEVSAQNQPEEWKDYNVESFKERLKPVEKYYTLHQMTSAEAAKLYNDKSIDFLMIDGDHAYEAIKQDITNFFPKIRSGGLIAGDDAFDATVAKAAIDAANELGLKAEILGIHFFISVP